MRFEHKNNSSKMPSAQATTLPPSRMFHKQEEDVRATAQDDNFIADNYYVKPPHAVTSPAGDNTAVESNVVEPPAPEIAHAKGDVPAEETLSTSPTLEDIITCADLSVPTAAECGSVDDDVEKFTPILPLPEKIKKMAFVRPFKPKIPHYKTYKKSRLGPPPPQTAAEDQPWGQYVPPASSPYPSLDVEEEKPAVAEAVQEEQPVEVYPNPFKSSCSVLRLSGGLFEEFLKQMDVTLVMFYKGALGQQDSRETWSKEQFVKASERTKRNNHAYAAVDCGKENSICNREEVTSFPLFRLYSKGHTVDTIKNYQSFDSETMQKFVEFSPVLEQRPRTDNFFSKFAQSSTRAIN